MGQIVGAESLKALSRPQKCRGVRLTRLQMKIRAYRDTDWSELLRMSLLLFPRATAEDLETDIKALRARADAEVFVAERPDGSVAGFVETGTRLYADGCDTSPVGYIEAWYVDPDVRRSGYGRALLAAAEDWARRRGYREMASDAQLDNEVSHAAHRRSGYEEVDRIVQFRRILVAFAAIALTAIPLRAQTDVTCVPAAERAGRTFGCFITARQELGPLPARPALYWHLDTFESRAAAERARAPRSTVVESLSTAWRTGSVSSFFTM